MREALRLDYPGPDGATLRDDLWSVYRQTGKWPSALDGAQVPPGGEYLWGLFWELRRGEPLSMQEIEAFGRLQRVKLTPWEVGTIRDMDAEVSAFIAGLVKKGGGHV